MDMSDGSLKINFEQSICTSEVDPEEDFKESSVPPDLLQLVEQEKKQIMPHKDLTEVINLGTQGDQKEVNIGTLIKSTTRTKLIDLLQEYQDVFAWSYQDMPGLDTNIVVHKLPIKPGCKPIRQKLRRMKPKMLFKIKEEVK